MEKGSFCHVHQTTLDLLLRQPRPDHGFDFIPQDAVQSSGHWKVHELNHTSIEKGGSEAVTQGRQAQWGRTGRYESKTSFSPRGLSQIRLGRSLEANHIASRSGMDPPRVTGPNLVAGRAGSNVRVPDSKQLRKLRAFQVPSFHSFQVKVTWAGHSLCSLPPPSLYTSPFLH